MVSFYTTEAMDISPTDYLDTTLLDRALEELHEAVSHAENAAILLEAYTDMIKPGSEHGERMLTYLGQLKNEHHDRECTGIDKEKEK